MDNAKLYLNNRFYCYKYEIKDFSEKLKTNSSLTSLNLESNKFKDEEIYYLSEALKVNTYVTSLNLSFNNIDDDEMKTLTDALKVNSSLTEIKFK